MRGWAPPLPATRSYGRRAAWDAWRVFVAHPARFYGLALVTTLVTGLLGLVSTEMAWVAATTLVGFIVGTVAAGLAALMTRDVLDGRPPGLRRAAAVLRSRIGSLLAATALLNVLPAIAAWFFAFSFVDPLAISRSATTATAAGAGLVVAATLGVIYLLVMLRLAYTIPAMVIDGLGVREAVEASWAASRRRKRAIVWIGIVYALAALPFVYAIFLVSPAPDPGATELQSSSTAAVAVASAVVGALIEPFLWVASAILYRRLRVADPAAFPAERAPASHVRLGWIVLVVLLITGLAGCSRLITLSAELGLQEITGRGAVTVGSGPPSGLACRAANATTVLHRGAPTYVWVAFLRSPTGPASDVVLVLRRDGAEVGRRPVTVSGSGFNCLYGQESPAGLAPGSYEIDVLVDGGLEADGTFDVIP